MPSPCFWTRSWSWLAHQVPCAFGKTLQATTPPPRQIVAMPYASVGSFSYVHQHLSGTAVTAIVLQRDSYYLCPLRKLREGFDAWLRQEAGKIAGTAAPRMTSRPRSMTFSISAASFASAANSTSKVLIRWLGRKPFSPTMAQPDSNTCCSRS